MNSKNAEAKDGNLISCLIAHRTCSKSQRTQKAAEIAKQEMEQMRRRREQYAKDMTRHDKCRSFRDTEEEHERVHSYLNLVSEFDHCYKRGSITEEQYRSLMSDLEIFL